MAAMMAAEAAVHESGHAVAAARLLGIGHVGAVTVEPRQGWRAATELIDLPDDERTVCALLAGWQAERVAAETGLDLAAHEPHEPVSTIVDSPAPLAIDDICFVRHGDSPSAEFRGDFERALALAEELVGAPDAVALVARLEQETRTLLRRELPTLTRLAGALLAHGSLGAADVAAILEPAMEVSR